MSKWSIKYIDILLKFSIYYLIGIIFTFPLLSVVSILTCDNFFLFLSPAKRRVSFGLYYLIFDHSYFVEGLLKVFTSFHIWLFPFLDILKSSKIIFLVFEYDSSVIWNPKFASINYTLQIIENNLNNSIHLLTTTFIFMIPNLVFKLYFTYTTISKTHAIIFNKINIC